MSASASFLFLALHLQNTFNSGRASSIALILAGSIYYTWLKNEEQADKERAAGTNVSKMEAGGYERVPMKDVDADIRKAEATQ